MARKTKAQIQAEKDAQKVERGINTLSEAIKFCAPGYKENGEPYSQFAVLWGGWMTTYNGVVMYGHPIAEEIQACPNFGQLQAAVKAIGAEANSITVIDANRLAIKGAKARYVVKCISDYSVVIRQPPDAPVGPLTSNMREGFEVMKQIASKSGEHVLTASILLRSGDMVASDLQLIVSYWHGLGFPTLTVPADFVEAILRIPKALVQFGYSERSLTFYFEDGSFVRTQLYSEEWPDVNKVLNFDATAMAAVPEGFFDALDKSKMFTDRNYVLLDQDEVRTHEETDVGCVVSVPGLLPCELGVDAVRLSKLAGRVTHLDYWTDGSRVCLAGENLRGVCANFEAGEEAGYSPGTPPPIAPPPMPPDQAFTPPSPPEAPVYTHLQDEDDGDDEEEAVPPPAAPGMGNFGPAV